MLGANARALIWRRLNRTPRTTTLATCQRQRPPPSAPGSAKRPILITPPGVRRKVEKDAIRSGLSHFVTHGFFEGRGGFDIAVDSKWYLATYPDVASAIKDKQVIDAKDHFMLFGCGEGRNPGPAFQRAVGEWNLLARADQE